MGLASNFTKGRGNAKAKTPTKASKSSKGGKAGGKGNTPPPLQPLSASVGKKGKGKGKAKTPVKTASGKNGKSKGKKAEESKVKGKGAKKGEKKVQEKPKTAEELDDEMAQYWFKAGKGPDPAQLKLDKEMESYMAEKKKMTTEETEEA
jgi:hypothetical protein